MKIVCLNESNRGLLETVADAVFDHAIDQAALDQFLNCPRHHLLLAVEDDWVLGMISAVEYFHPDKPPQLWINELAVTPSRWRQGIGRELVNSMLNLAQESGCAGVWLGTERDNLNAQRCFESVAGGKTAAPFLLYEWPLDD